MDKTWKDRRIRGERKDERETEKERERERDGKETRQDAASIV